MNSEQEYDPALVRLLEELTDEPTWSAVVIAKRAHAAGFRRSGWEYGLEDPAWGVKRTGSEGLMRSYQKIHGGRVKRRRSPGPWLPLEDGEIK